MSKKIRTLPEELALPFGGADTHAHLNDEKYKDDLPAVIQRARACGVAHIGNIFGSSTELEEGENLFSNYSEVFFQLGIHPCETHLWSAEEEERLFTAADKNSRVKAIGEIGLDYYWDTSTKKAQQNIFIAQLRMAKKLALPVSIHSRDAADDTMAILENEGFKDYPVLWHCFGEGAELASKILSMGWHISVPGVVTFKKNSDLREVMPLIPAERLHLETDCPYLAPEPWRGERNEPAFVAFTAKAVAEARQICTGELWLQCGKNCKNFFDL